MKIWTLPARELTPELTGRWEEILADAPEFAGPYFRPEYLAAVAQVRPGAEVAVLEDSGIVVGFFPFERTRWNVARPVGGTLSDYQGVIVAPGVEWRPAELMASCRLSAWEFDHQLACQSPLSPHFARVEPSAYLDLSKGYETWLGEQKKCSGAWLSGALRKQRKLERERHGVSFEWHSGSSLDLKQLATWKSAQYRRTGLSDIFARPWIVRLIEEIHSACLPNFRGVLNVLRSDEKLLAAHFGMQAGGVLHYWFPAYCPEEARHSPGQTLLLLIAQHAAEHGVTRIDLGKGREEYKLKLASGATEVAEGCVDFRPFAGHVRRGYGAARDWIKQSPLRRPAQIPVRWLKRMSQWFGEGTLAIASRRGS